MSKEGSLTGLTLEAKTLPQAGAEPPLGVETLPKVEHKVDTILLPPAGVEVLPNVEPNEFINLDHFLHQAKEHGYVQGTDEELNLAFGLFYSNITQEVTNAVRTAIINADNKGRQVLDTEDIQSVLKMHKTFCNLPEATTITEK
jgi:hypothetical protein